MTALFFRALHNSLHPDEILFDGNEGKTSVLQETKRIVQTNNKHALVVLCDGMEVKDNKLQTIDPKRAFDLQVHLVRAQENEQLDKPYYVGKVWPIAGNTQGGPRSNENREVVDPFGEPLGNVYTAGECGSIFGHLYLSAGNFTECFTSAIAISDHVEKLNK